MGLAHARYSVITDLKKKKHFSNKGNIATHCLVPTDLVDKAQMGPAFCFLFIRFYFSEFSLKCVSYSPRRMF